MIIFPRPLLFLIFAFWLLPLTAKAGDSPIVGILTKEDASRISFYEETRQEAIDLARKAGDPEMVRLLDQILAGTPQSVDGEDLTGDYRCRIARLAGFQPVVVYGWFACGIIRDDERRFLLEKRTGSERLRLTILPLDNKRFFAYGADYYDEEAPRAYNEVPQRNRVGFLVKPEGGRYRVEFPLPFFTHGFDILELERR